MSDQYAETVRALMDALWAVLPIASIGTSVSDQGYESYDEAIELLARLGHPGAQAALNDGSESG